MKRCFAGIGYEVAKWLAMMGGTVIVACRSEDKAVEVFPLFTIYWNKRSDNDFFFRI